MSRRAIMVTAVVVCVAVGVGLATFALAQPPGGPGGYGSGGPGGAMMGPQQPRGAAIAATAEAVFVVSGQTLYKFDANTLELVSSAAIPVPQRLAGALTQ